MTTNELLIYLGGTLFLFAALFPVLGSVRKRPEQASLVNQKEQETAKLSKRLANLAAEQRADFFCAGILFALAVGAELFGFARGGPLVGERSGNLPGAILLIALTSLLCVSVCLIARHRLERRLRAGEHSSTPMA